MRWPSALTAVLGLAAGATLIVLLPERTLFTATEAHATAVTATPGERWACPMIDFIGTKSGPCPVCGMAMTKVTADELSLEQQRRMGITLTTVTSGPATATIHAYGAVRYDDRTLQVVIPRLAGRIVKRHPSALHPGTLVAAITWVSPELNAEIRAREVHLHLSDPNHRLLVGSLVHARFSAALDANLLAAEKPATVTLVPKTAVLSTGVRHVAWRVSGKKDDGRLTFALAPLALGPRLESANGQDHYIVRAGLAPGDEVATQGAFLIDSQAQLAGTPSLLFPLGATTAPAHQH